MNPRVLMNPEDIRKFDDGNVNLYRENRKGAILIESYTGNESTGFLLILPLFSKSKPTKKQAVLFSNLSYTKRDEALMLIREGLMYSWELGYHAAFALETDLLYNESGFMKTPDNLFHQDRMSLFFSELSWNGIKRISHDLIFPFMKKN